MTSTSGKVLASLFACLVVVFVLGYIHEQRIRAAAEVVSAARQVQIDALQKSIAQYQADRVQTAANLAKQIAVIKQQNAKPWTPQQAAVEVNTLPALPVQAQVDTTTQNLVVPAVDVPALQAYKATCDETTARLGACQLTAASFQGELAATKSEFTIMTADRDNWRNVAKGGTFWYRVGGASKHAGCGALGGSTAAKSGTGTNAAIYGSAAFGVCEVGVWLVPKIFHHGKKGE